MAVSDEAPTLWVGNDERMLALFEEVLDLLEHGYTPIRLLCASQAAGHLMARMVRATREHAQGRTHVRQQVAGSIRFMRQHLNRSLKVAGLAAVAGLSPSHYSAMFRDYTGYSPMDYFIRLRMHRACQLLDTTTLEVKQVAAEVGYDDPLYFSRVFRTVNEMSPTAYRLGQKG